MIIFTTHPEIMQQDSKFARDRHYSSFLCRLSAALGQVQSLTTQAAPFSKGTQDVVGAAHQQAAQVLIPSLGDPSFWLRIAGLVPSGEHAQIGSHFAALFEAFYIFQGEHIPCSGLHQDVLRTEDG